MDPAPVAEDVAETIDDDDINIKVNNQINWHNVMERAGALGWSVEQLNKATLPEFIHFFRGWQRSKGIDPDAEVSRANVPMTRGEAQELFAKYA